MRISNSYRLFLILDGLDSEGFVTRPERQPNSTTVLANTEKTDKSGPAEK